MLKIKRLSFKDLTEHQVTEVPNNGCGKEYARYLQVSHDDEVIALVSDAMEPEDVSFDRSLNWIFQLLLKCYEFGLEDAD